MALQRATVTPDVPGYGGGGLLHSAAGVTVPLPTGTDLGVTSLLHHHPRAYSSWHAGRDVYLHPVPSSHLAMAKVTGSDGGQADG